MRGALGHVRGRAPVSMCQSVRLFEGSVGWLAGGARVDLGERDAGWI